MLFDRSTLERIGDGSVTVAVRCWKRPTVRVGSTLRTPVGVLGIDAVEVIDAASLTDADARDAGASSVEELLGDGCPPDRRLYRIRFHLAGEDPRIALRAEADLDDATLRELAATLAGWDRRSRTGPWTTTVLGLIRDRPGVVSTELADELGMDRPAFKQRVRRLKELGLTESLEVGYRLSPRGAAFLDG